MAEYHVPVHMDVPEMNVIWTDIPDPHAPDESPRSSGVGITGTAAAVANARVAESVCLATLPLAMQRNNSNRIRRQHEYTRVVTVQLAPFRHHCFRLREGVPVI